MALRWAARAAAMRRVPLRVVHGRSGYCPLYADVPAAADSQAGRARESVRQAVESGVHDTFDIVVEKVASSESGIRTLLHESKRAQLLVVGSRGLGGFARLLPGSVSHQCALHAACDVAVARTRLRPPSGEYPG